MKGKQLIRILLATLGALFGVVILVGMGIIAKGEWSARVVHDHTAPTFATQPPTAQKVAASGA